MSMHACADADGGGGYGYAAGSANGPENWAKLSPANKMCGEGKRQSPVNIVTKQAVSAPNLDTLTRTYAAADATIINNGHDISVRPRT
jgi:carbonic anhydrase